MAQAAVARRPGEGVAFPKQKRDRLACGKAEPFRKSGGRAARETSFS